MPLTKVDLESLQPILHDAVVRIRVGEVEGTGFFVAPRRVLTCYHVVVGAITGNLRIELVDAEHRTTPAQVLEQRGPGWPDLALLSVDLQDLPCPLLTIESVARGVAVVAAGYVAGSKVPYQTRSMISGGDSQYDDSGQPYLRLDDDPVVPGMSGGPVVDATSGLVAGVVRLTLGDRIDAGGFAIPMATVIQHLPALRSFYDRPPPAAKRWIDALGARNLKEAKRAPSGVRFDADLASIERIDLEIAMQPGGSRGWRVFAVKEPKEGVEVGVSALGNDVMEALERWSQRQTFGGGPEEDLILGRVLYRALLPEKIENLLAGTQEKGDVLLRVRVSSENRLAAIPWEYARANDEALPIAAASETPFARFVDVPSKPVEPDDRLKVLGIVQAPRDFRIPRYIGFGGPNGPPESSASLKRSLEATLGGQGRIDGRVVADVDLKALDSGTDNGQEERVHVIHYIGFAWDDGTVLSRIGNSPVQPVSLEYFARAIAGRQPSVLVMQILPVQVDSPSVGLGLVRALRLLAGSVQAVVLAQHCATDRHISTFNERFYQSLASGESVELAVQHGRLQLRDAPPYEDTTAFGTVSVTTTFGGDLRLVTPTAQSNRSGDAELARRAPSSRQLP